MGIENFDSEPEYVKDNDPDTVRARVPSDSHEEVKQFSITLGVNLPQAYRILIENSLDDDELRKSILENEAREDYKFSDFHRNLLDELCSKIKELQYFPDIEEFNNDEETHDFPIFILSFGSLDNIFREIENRRPEVYEIMKED